MEGFKRRRFSILTFIALVSFSTWMVIVLYGYLIRGRGYVNVLTTPVASLTTHDHHLRKVPQIKENTSTIDEICQRSEVKLYNGNMSKSQLKSSKYLLFKATKVCFCVVPKAASTSLLRSLLIAEYPEQAHYYETIAGSFIHGQRKLRLSKSTSRACSAGSEISFFVTRDPYQRLFSAYVDKIFLEKYRGMAHTINPSQSYITKAKEFLETKLLPSTNKSQICDVANVTFGDFVNHIIQEKSRDRHFVPATSLCNPCKHHFDLIMKQENMHEQMDKFMTYLNKSRALSKEEPVSDYSGIDGVQRTASSFYTFATRKCEMTMTRQDAIHRRLWDALKILGNIDDSLEFNSSWFSIPSFNSTGTEIANFLVKNLQDGGVQTLDPTQRDAQRQRHLVQAYKSVSDKLIEDIQKLYMLDFAIFGYDIEPPK